MAAAAEPGAAAAAEIAPADARAWRRAALLVLGLLIALLAPLWLNLARPVWDGFDFYFPAFTYLSDSLREGRFPLWDPYTNCGEPFHADPQRMVLSPLALLFGLFIPDAYRGFILLWIAHWLWAAAGMLWLSRRLGASPAGGVLAAISYALSGFFVAHAEHVPYLVVAAWLPWILGLADGAVARRDRADALLAGAALAACALGGGYPMLVSFAALATALWLGLRYLILPAPSQGPLRERLAWVLGTLATMGVVLVVAWLPVLHAFVSEASPITSRLGWVDRATAINGSPFTLRAATSLFFPYATVAFWRRLDFGADVSMLDAYLGFATVPLAITWARLSSKKEPRWWLVAFTAFMVLTSLGAKGGVRIALHYLFPPLRFMRFNAPFRLFWILPLCLAAGLGLTALCSRDGVAERAARRFFAGAVAVWSLAALAVAAVLVSWLPAARLTLGPLVPRLFLPAAAVAPVLLGLALWACSRAPPQRLRLLLACLACADAGAHLYVNDFTTWSWDPELLARVESFHQTSTDVRGEPPPRRADQFSGSFNANQVFKVALVKGYTSLVSTEFGQLTAGRFLEVLAGPQRFWLARGSEQEPPREAALAELARLGKGDALPVYRENSALAAATPAAAAPASRTVPGSFGEVRVDWYKPEEIELTVQVPAPGAILASTERFVPGWRALVDGAPAEVFRTNLFFRGLSLAPGVHRVLWRYQPPLWWPLVILSTAAQALAIGAAVVLKRRGR